MFFPSNRPFLPVHVSSAHATMIPLGDWVGTLHFPEWRTVHQALSLVQRHWSNSLPFSLSYMNLFLLSASSLPSLQKHGIFFLHLYWKETFLMPEHPFVRHHSITLLPAVIHRLEKILCLSWHTVFPYRHLLTLSPFIYSWFLFLYCLLL